MATATPVQKNTDEARALSKSIHEIVDRLLQPPTDQDYARMREFIRKGADLEVLYNGENETVLYTAIARRYTEAAVFLLHQGADPNTPCVQGITPFIFAAVCGNKELLEAVFDSGRAPPVIDGAPYDSGGEYKSALICAAEFNNPDCATLLIRHGADMNWKNNAGKSAVDYARERGYGEVIGMMEAATRAAEANKMAAAINRGTEEPVRVMKRLRLKKNAKGMDAP